MSDRPRATVREVDGQLVLDDPDALGVMRAVAKHNCFRLLELNAEHIKRFVRRVAELGRSPADTVIVVLNVDDMNGGVLAELLMPKYDWSGFRACGEIPVARGLANRDGIEHCLSHVDPEAQAQLVASTELAVVVVDHGVAAVFAAGTV